MKQITTRDKIRVLEEVITSLEDEAETSDEATKTQLQQAAVLLDSRVSKYEAEYLTEQQTRNR